MRKWLKGLFTEKENSPSIGSAAFALIVLIFGFDYVWSAIRVQPLRMSATDIAWLAVSLYAVKKIAPMFQGIKAYFGDKNADPGRT
jgi:hypothetical protein